MDVWRGQRNGGSVTVSAWWVVWAFLGGASTGMLVMVLMFMSRAEEDRMDQPVDMPPTDLPIPPDWTI